MENTTIKVALFKKIADNNQSYSTVVMNNEAQKMPKDAYQPILAEIDEDLWNYINFNLVITLKLM